MSGAILGVDISSWQHPDGAPIDWAKVKASGVAFVMVKATQGETYVNPYAKADLAGARAAHLLVGAYHFYEQGSDPTAQGANFKNNTLGELLPLGAWIDWEPGEMPDYEVSSAYNALHAEMGAVRKPVGTYLDLSWQERFKTLNLVIHRLWSADPSAASAPAGAFIWQRASTPVEGIEGDVDTDVLLSTRGINLDPWAAPVKPVEEQKLEEQPPESANAAESPAGDDQPALAGDSPAA